METGRIDIRKYIEDGIPIPIGTQGEGGIRYFVFGYADYAEECGEGTITILHQRPGDEVASPVTITTEDNKATWVISSTDTAYAGQGQIQVVYTSDKVKKSMVGRTQIEPSLTTLS